MYTHNIYTPYINIYIYYIYTYTQGYTHVFVYIFINICIPVEYFQRDTQEIMGSVYLWKQVQSRAEGGECVKQEEIDAHFILYPASV